LKKPPSAADDKAAMSATKKKRLILVALGTMGAILIYMGIYFACVSIEFRYPMQVGGKGFGNAHAYYRVGPFSQGIAQSVFEPARLLDAYYLRPGHWADQRHD
jgi:hypothetical protein